MYSFYVQYGKNKGKEREGQPAASFTTHGTSVAQTLSNPTTGKTHASSPLRGLVNSTKKAGPSILRGQNDHPTLPPLSTPARGTYAPSMGPPSSPVPSPRSRNGSSVAHHHGSSATHHNDPSAPMPSSSPRRGPADTATYVHATSSMD